MWCFFSVVQRKSEPANTLRSVSRADLTFSFQSSKFKITFVVSAKIKLLLFTSVENQFLLPKYL